ncbi:cytochrome P450 71AU50-like [Rutidosis leptorrhynchoides]|uniref:cytochrome P450 71AU50-like n=1 Tax=Rutidosis leptorrhynchoides TaxID=125765 RepID=UPI003A99F37C
MILSNKDDLTLASLTFLAIIFAISWYKSTKDRSRFPPGPIGLPVLGYIPFLGPNLHHEFTKLAQRYGSIFKLNLGSKTVIVVSSSDLAKVVLREQDDIFANRDPPVAGLVITYGGQNILWSDNNLYWRNLRKLLVHEVLNNKNLQDFSSLRRSEVRKTLKYVYENIGKEVDISRVGFLTSMNVVINMMWGKSLVEDEKINKSDVEFQEVISKIVELLGTANLSDFFPGLSRLDLQGVKRQMKQQLKTMDNIFETMFQDRIKLNNNASKAKEQEGKKDFLQILLELKDQDNTTSFKDTQVKALLMDIFTGGTDTTSTMVGWTMAELMQNQDVMKIVQNELKEVVGLHNIVEESHLSELHHLEAVIKETFRLHPPLPLLISRSPNQSCMVGGYSIPKGSNVYLNIWSIHRDPHYWDEPLKFNHNRFLNLDGVTKFDYNGTNCNFLPFGSGKRMCPGVRLGEKMLMYILASLLHSFDWTLPDGNKLDLSDKFGIVMKKKEPLVVIPSKRLAQEDLYM